MRALMTAEISTLHGVSLPRRGRAIIRVSWEKDGTTSPEIQRYAIEQCIQRENIHVGPDDWITCADDHDYSASRPVGVVMPTAFDGPDFHDR